jgi:hypothetical protein
VVEKCQETMQDTAKDGWKKGKKGEKEEEKIARQALVSGKKRALLGTGGASAQRSPATGLSRKKRPRKKKKISPVGPGNGQPTSPDLLATAPEKYMELLAFRGSTGLLWGLSSPFYPTVPSGLSLFQLN